MTEDYRRSVLPNGIRVITERMPHVRSVAVGVWVETGSRREPENRGGQKRDEKVEDESLRAAVAEEAGCDREKLRPVLTAYGEYRAGLDDDLEELRLLAGVVEQRPGDDQMSGA